MLCFLFVMSFLSFTAQDLTKKFVRFQNKTESKETMKHWVLEPSRDRPYFFPFVQYVTKTRLHRSLPPEVTRSNPQIDVGKLKKLVSETGQSTIMHLSRLFEFYVWCSKSQEITPYFFRVSLLICSCVGGCSRRWSQAEGGGDCGSG